MLCGFLDKYIDETVAETLYSVYEPSFMFTPDDVNLNNGFQEIVITTKIPKKSDFLEVVVSSTSPVDTALLWIDTSVMGTAGVLKEYVEDSWQRKLTTMTCYDMTTRLVYSYRQIFDFWYQTPVDFDNFEIKCFYPVFTMYPEFIRLIPSATEPTPFKGAYWLKTDDNVFRAKYDGTEFKTWEDTGISTTYIFANTFPAPPFPSQYGVPIKGYYDVADTKCEFNNINTEWSPHSSETYSKTTRLDAKGLNIISVDNTMIIDEDEIVAKFLDTDIFRITKDTTFFKKIEIQELIKLGEYITEVRTVNGDEMLIHH